MDNWRCRTRHPSYTYRLLDANKTYHFYAYRLHENTDVKKIQALFYANRYTKTQTPKSEHFVPYRKNLRRTALKLTASKGILRRTHHHIWTQGNK